MKFSSESALQAFLHAYLGGEREVTLSPACRIDLRTDQYDIEIKLVLSNSAMDKAAGQLRRYSTYSEGRKQVIAGCAPKNFNASNRRRAQSFRDAGIEVWFVDREPEFQEAYQALYHPKTKPTPPKPNSPKSPPPKPVPSVHSQRTTTPDSILKLSPLLAQLAKEGHSAAIAKMMSSKDPESELTTVQSAIKWKLYVDGKKLSSGEFVRRTETAAESEFINSPIIEKVIKKRRREAEEADPRKRLPFLTPPKPTSPKSPPLKPVSSVPVQTPVSEYKTNRMWFLCSLVGLLFFVFLGPLMIFVDRYVIDLRLSPVYEYMNETQISTPGYTTEDLVARSAPNSSSDVVFRVSRNESRVLNVSDDKGNGWVEIVVDGQSGWVYLPSMKLVDP